MILKIPLRNDLPAYNFQIDLDEVTYDLAFSYNVRANHWVMNISNSSGDVLVSGIPLLTGWDLLNRYKANPNIPQGVLTMIDTAGENKNADTEDVGQRVVMLYKEAE